MSLQYVDTRKIDERYTLGAYSSTFMVKNILNFVGQTFGQAAKAEIQQGFKLGGDFLNQKEARVNITLSRDLVSYLKARFQLSDHAFYEIGRYTAATLKNTNIEAELQRKESVSERVNFFIHHCSEMFDLNFSYSVTRINSSYLIIEARPREDVLELLQIPPQRFGNEALRFYQRGMLSSIGSIGSGDFIPVARVSSALYGDESTCYVMDLSGHS